MRKRFWPAVLRVNAYHWRWHVNDWARVTVGAGTVIGTKQDAMIYARRQAEQMDKRYPSRTQDNN